MGKIQVQDLTVNDLLKHNWVILGFRSLGTKRCQVDISLLSYLSVLT